MAICDDYLGGGSGLTYRGANCFGHCCGRVEGFPAIFFKMYFLYMSPSWRKKLCLKFYFIPPKIGCYFWGGSCCAGIEVLTPRLRCSCRDCCAHAEIEVPSCSSILTYAPQRAIVRRSPPRRSPPQTFTTPSVKSDVHHPRRSPPPV